MFAALKILSLVWSKLMAKIKSPKKTKANKLEVMIQVKARNLELVDTKHKVSHLFFMGELNHFTNQINLRNRRKIKKAYGYINKILRRIQFVNWIN